MNHETEFKERKHPRIFMMKKYFFRSRRSSHQMQLFHADASMPLAVMA